MDSTTVTLCRRGHTSPRNRFGQCPECLRDSRRTYNKRRPKAARPVAMGSQAQPLAEPTASPIQPAAPGTFLAVANEWLAGQDNNARKTVTKRAFLLAQLEKLHDRPIAELTVPDVVRVLKEIESVRDRRESARRAGGLAGQIIRYAAQHGYIPVNILPDGTLRGALKPVKTASHAAITDPRPGDSHDSALQRFGRLLYSILTYELIQNPKNHPSVQKALTLAPYVFVRPGELRQMHWSEVNLDKAEWIIPPERMKMRRPFLVPLSQQALALLREQRAVTGSGTYVFPAKARTNQRHGEQQPISDNGFVDALRICLGMMHEPKSAMTMHGFRSCASTLLKGTLRVESELVELQLAHAKSDKIASIYDRDQRVPERVEMMQKWADYIDHLRTVAAKAAGAES